MKKFFLSLVFLMCGSFFTVQGASRAIIPGAVLYSDDTENSACIKKIFDPNQSDPNQKDIEIFNGKILNPVPAWATEPFKAVGIKVALCLINPDQEGYNDPLPYFGVVNLRQGHAVLRVNKSAIAAAKKEHSFISPEMVKAIMIHEVAHVVYDHSFKKMLLEEFLKIQWFPGHALGMQDFFTYKPQGLSEAFLMLGIYGLCGYGLTELVKACYSKHCEREADRYILTHGNRENVQAALTYFEILSYIEKSNLEENPKSWFLSILDHWYSTHPADKDRAAFFEDALEKMDS